MDLGQKTKHPYIYYSLKTNTYSVRVKLDIEGQKPKFKAKSNFKTLDAAVQWRNTKEAEHLMTLKKAKIKQATILEMAAFAKSKKESKRKNWVCISLYLERAKDFFGETLVDDLKPAVIEGYADHLKKQSLSDETIRKHLGEIRWMMNQAIANDWGSRKFVMPELDPCGTRELNITMSDFRKVVAHLPWYQKPILRVALITMQRRSNLFNMMWDQYDGEMLRYRPDKTWKRYREGVVVKVPDELASELKSLPRICDYMFPNPLTEKPYENFTKSLTTACKNAGVTRFTLHDVKHLGITEALRMTGGNVDLVSRISATSPKLIRERYGHLCDRGNELVAQLSAEVYRLECA